MVMTWRLYKLARPGDWHQSEFFEAETPLELHLRALQALAGMHLDRPFVIWLEAQIGERWSLIGRLPQCYEEAAEVLDEKATQFMTVALLRKNRHDARRSNR